MDNKGTKPDEEPIEYYNWSWRMELYSNEVNIINDDDVNKIVGWALFMMKKKYYRKKRGPVNSKKTTVDGITFASGLETYMYKALKTFYLEGTNSGTLQISEFRALSNPNP